MLQSAKRIEVAPREEIVDDFSELELSTMAMRESVEDLACELEGDVTDTGLRRIEQLVVQIQMNLAAMTRSNQEASRAA